MTEAGCIVGVPALGVGQSEPACEAGELTVFTGMHDQMPMVRHLTITEQPHLKPLDRFRQYPLKRGVVFVRLKDRHPGIRPIEHMIKISRLSDPFWSSHNRYLRGNHLNCHFKVPDTFLLSGFVQSNDFDTVMIVGLVGADTVDHFVIQIATFVLLHKISAAGTGDEVKAVS